MILRGLVGLDIIAVDVNTVSTPHDVQNMTAFLEVALTPPAVAATSPPRGAILHDQLEARVFPPAEAALPES